MELKGHGRLRKLEGRGTPRSDWPSTYVTVAHGTKAQGIRSFWPLVMLIGYNL